MGLAERRAIKSFEDEKFPQLKSKIDEAAGFEMPVEVDWPSLAADGYAHMYDEALPKVYFEPLIGAFAQICVDDMGKEALKESLKKVIIKNTEEFHSAPRCYQFEDGTLTFDHRPISNIDDIKERTKKLVELLESKL